MAHTYQKYATQFADELYTRVDREGRLTLEQKMRHYDSWLKEKLITDPTELSLLEFNRKRNGYKAVTAKAVKEQDYDEKFMPNPRMQAELTPFELGESDNE